MNAISAPFEWVKEQIRNKTLPREAYPGYRLTERSRKFRDAFEEQERKMREEEAAYLEQYITRTIIDKIHDLIDWAYSEYETAKHVHRNHLRIITDLTLNWSPERVLSTRPDFEGLCQTLRDEKLWKMLDRKERKFIAAAYAIKLSSQIK